ncbi:FxsA family protein [Corallococcus macrosporus]|uniref:Exclusion protein FxsA n=1 Tax=Corallococcus macrosporus DSM 14697 TaxID=1189310 RepID=A0A250K0S1_9BACT|nr:FxsA family protein [Corallococcus macrosporus]ATB49709.1 exclusion protein FxsA [Corallococcus macrosporus DSM 14697]
MFRYLLLALIVVPILELYLLLAIGRQLGPTPTLAWVLLSGLVGAWLSRREGRRVLRQWRESMARGQVPEEGILSGVLVLAGGVLLVIPGVITDGVGLLLLLPPVRRLISARVRRALERKVRDGSMHVTTFGGGAFGGGFHASVGGPFPGGPVPRTPHTGVFEPDAGATGARRPQGPQAEVDAEFTEEKPGRS